MREGGTPHAAVELLLHHLFKSVRFLVQWARQKRGDEIIHIKASFSGRKDARIVLIRYFPYHSAENFVDFRSGHVSDVIEGLGKAEE